MNLSCSVLSGWPEPSITWVHTGSSSEEGRVVGQGPTLKMADVRKLDAGVYTCQADNGFSSQPSQESVNVVVQCKCYIFAYTLFCNLKQRDQINFIHIYYADSIQKFFN